MIVARAAGFDHDEAAETVEAGFAEQPDLTLTLSAEAAATIGIPEVATIRLDVDAGALAAFREGLPRVVNWGRAGGFPALAGF